MRLHRKDLSKAPRAIRRMVERHADKAVERLARRRGRISDAAVHDARKELKKIRALLPALAAGAGDGAVEKETRVFRDAGRPLSAVRDARVLIDTLDGLLEHFAGRVQRRTFQSFRNALLARRRELHKEAIAGDGDLPRLVNKLGASRRRIHRWKTPGGWKVFAGAVRVSYRDARRALRQTAGGDVDAWHELRKRTKVVRYQMELLDKLWPQALAPLSEMAVRVTDLLGTDHDLDVLAEIAGDEPGHRLDERDRELLLGLIAERRHALQTEASRLAGELLADRPRAFIARLKHLRKEVPPDGHAAAKGD